MPEFAPVINVASLNGATGFRLDGDAAGDRSGYASSGAGDINGDGLADLLIGAPSAEVLGTDWGAAWVAFGAASSPANQTLGARVTAGSTYMLVAEAPADEAGISVSAAGDVNGDGFDDLLVGAWLADPDAPGENRGASYLVFGGAAKLEAADTAGGGNNDNVIALASLTAANGFRFDGAAFGDVAGFSVSGGGDVNGDGFADLIVGALGASTLGGSINGASYIVFGGANLGALDAEDGTADGRIDLAQVSAGQGLRLDGARVNSGDRSGGSVAFAGDVNGDGFDDVLVGASFADPNGANNDEGAAYLVFGRSQAQFAAGADTLDLGALDGLEGTRFDGVMAGDTVRAVNGLGDVNGDGFADFVIGAPGADPNGNSNAGSAYVVLGKSSFSANQDLSALNGTNGFRLDGARAGDLTGIAVSGAGDVNGDGFEDILIGSYMADRFGAIDCGAAYVIFGKATGFAAVIDLGSLDGNTGFRIEGAAQLDMLGMSAAAAGDANGDGFDDIIVGASGAGNNALAGSGSTYIVYGHRSEIDVVRTGTALDNRINGGKGDDIVTGLSGNDTLLGWEADDTINGGSGNDVITGGTGDDTITGGDGNDTVDGGEGTDTISLGSGADMLTVSIGGDDDMTGGSGKDTLDFRPLGAAAISIDLAARIATLANGDIMTMREFEQVRATTGADTILGDDRNNSLLEGNTGNDIINGRGGADFIAGNGGKDTMTGGTGVDRFDFNLTTDSTTSAATRDVITDFKLGGELDKIDILTIDAIAGGGTSNDTFSFVTGAFTAAGQVRAVQSGADTIIELNTSGTSVAETTILLTGITATTITAADFFL